MTFSRPTLRLSFILAVFLLALPWAASAQTAGAANNEDPTNPNYVLSMFEPDGDESFEGELTAEVTAQLYGFVGSAGDIVTISMTQDPDSALDPYIVLLGPAGQVVARDDDSGEASLSALINEVELPANGSYFVLASSYNTINDTTLTDEEAEAFEGATYVITATGMTPPPDEESLYFTSRLELNTEFPGGYSTPEEPVYFFTYVATEGEVIDISMSSEQFDTFVMVFAPGGNRIAANDDGEGVGTNSSLTGVVLEEAAKYLVFATDVAFPNVGNDEAALVYEGGDFTITVSAGEKLTK